MDPSTSTNTRPKPLIAILAVVIPLVAIGVAAVVTTSSSKDSSATATTIAQDGDPAASRPGGGGKGEAPATTAADAATDTTAKGASTSTTTTRPGPNLADEVPSGANAGPEGERTAVTYPQPTVPAGGCTRTSGTAVITLGSKARPGCLELGTDQPVIVRNRTGKEVSFIAISVNEVVAAGSELRIGTAGSAFGDGRSTFWSPGNPQLSGIVVVS